MRGLCQLYCVTIILMATACGGSSDGPPGPLNKHIDDMHIARIPLDQQGTVVEAQNKWSISKMEAANAEAQVQESDSQLHQARNDHKASRLAIDSAIAAKKSAELSSDMNRINAAQNDLRNAEASEKAAKERVKYFEAYQRYLKKYHRYTQENMYWREAQYEAAKAQIAKSNSISPKGLNLADFPAQAEQRGKRTEKAKGGAEGEKQKAVNARQSWLSQQGTADKATGRTGTLYDPMQPKEGGPTMSGGGVSQEKSEQKASPGSAPGNMNGTPASTGEGSAAQPQQ